LQLLANEFGELADEVQEGFHQSRSRIRLAIPADLPPLQSDRDRAAEILVNLVDNALKYSPADSLVEIGAAASSDGRLRFWVADHGIGIEESDLGLIFDRFYQSDQSSTRRYGGVGLGLHLVKHLAETLGGSVEVVSSPGLGSTFTVTLPLRFVSRGEDAVAEPVPEGRSQTAKAKPQPVPR